MTVTYDPDHLNYYNEDDLRQELTRVYDLCHGCRLCFNLCPSFPTLFNAIDKYDGEVASLTHKEQDIVVDQCYQCKLCYIKCPYVPPHEWELDFPRLMMRANALKQKKKTGSIKERMADQALSRTDLAGAVSTVFSGVVNPIVTKPGGIVRKAMEPLAGISSKRLLPPYTKVRFSTWWKKRGAKKIENEQERVAIFQTCFVEYMAPEVGKDLVGVLEHNEISCTVPSGVKCCGAPWLHSGNVDMFKKVAEQNVARLSIEAAQGRAIVVPEPTCSYIIKEDYPKYLKSDEAKLVASQTFDTSEYLVSINKSQDRTLKSDFNGEYPKEVTYHAPCHLRAQNIGFKTRDLLKGAGVKVNIVTECSGIDGTWGYRVENQEESVQVSKKLMSAVKKGQDAGVNTVVGECHLANTAILESTGSMPLHPMQILARAYGLDEE